MALDKAVYSLEAVPEIALKKIFVASNLPLPLRTKLADAGFVTVDMIANLADSVDSYKTAIATLFAEDELGTPAQRMVTLTLLATIWRKCSSRVKHIDSQRQRLEEDPTHIPEIAVPECAEMRSAFVLAPTRGSWNA